MQHLPRFRVGADPQHGFKLGDGVRNPAGRSRLGPPQIKMGFRESRLTPDGRFIFRDRIRQPARHFQQCISQVVMRLGVVGFNPQCGFILGDRVRQ